MLIKTFRCIKSKFLSGSELSLKVKKNIIALFLIKGYSVLLSFLLIPITLDILGSYKYGIWITIFNILSMMQIMDIGIGNGLKNNFTKALVNNDKFKAKEYVSTAYIMLTCLSILVCVIFFTPWKHIAWANIFNTSSSLNEEIRNLLGITFILTIVFYVLNLINVILISSHKSAQASFILALSNSIIYFVFFIFKEEFFESLFFIGFVYTLVPVIILVIANIYLFSGHFKDIRPSFSYFNRKRIRDLSSLGARFFIIQVSILIIFQTDALIISHYLNPIKVTPYNIVYKYFSVITVLVTMILTPMWSAYTDAKERKDYAWIKNVLRKQFKGFFAVVLIILIMLLMSKTIIDLWLGEKLKISSVLLISTAIFMVFNIWNIAIGTFLNGINKTKNQVITSIIGLTINIPLSILLLEQFGSGGVILASTISISFFSIFGTIEVFKTLKILE